MDMVKAHVWILRNKLADTLAKDAATNLDIAECYNKVPKSVVKRELEDRSVDKCQKDWNRSTNGKITKDHFPIVAERLKIKITTTHNFTTMVTAHGNIKA
jgi:IS1 family transposase